jgi:hypothetical protein
VPSLRLISVDARAVPQGSRPAAVGEAIAAAAADIAVVHGAPHLLRWRSRCGEIARHAGMVVVGGGRVAGRNLVLSTLGVDFVEVEDVQLGSNPLAATGFSLARLARGGRPFALVGASLSSAADAVALKTKLPLDVPVIASVRPGFALLDVLDNRHDDRIAAPFSVAVTPVDGAPVGAAIADLVLPD